MKRSRLAVAVLATLAVSTAVRAETYQVGPDRPIKALKDVLDKLKPGDVAEIDPGVYREVMKVKVTGTAEAPIVIRGVAGKPRPVFDAEGIPVTGKGPVPRAIFQLESAYVVLEHLELKNARNGDTAAGIRLNGSTNAIIRDCYIHHCDLGVFGDDKETVTIEGCEIAFNSTDKWRGYAHSFYMHGNAVVVRGCYVHDSPFGQNFKTRAHYNELWYNWIVDSDEGEVGPVDEHRERYLGTDKPNSNTLLVGNVIVSKPNREGNPGKFILFGSELKDTAGHNGTLYMFNNTLVAGSDKIIFVQLADRQASAVIRNNIFYGSPNILSQVKPAVSVTGSNNWLPAGAKVPDGLVDSIQGGDPGFVNPAARDFRLKADSPCANRGLPLANIEYVDGKGVKHTLTLDQCYQPHRMLAPRKLIGLPDLGAYELGAQVNPPPASQPEAKPKGANAG